MSYIVYIGVLFVNSNIDFSGLVFKSNELISRDELSSHSNVIKRSILSARRQNKKEAEHKSLSPLITLLCYYFNRFASYGRVFVITTKPHRVVTNPLGDVGSNFLDALDECL